MTDLAPVENLDIIYRLLAAALLGSLIGLNRELRGKPAGLRTHALVSLGAALLVIITLRTPGGENGGADAMSRVIQGVITGIGFLGAGVIMQRSGGRVTGLTSAAMIWIAAAFGVACGLGRWLETVAGGVIVVLVLLLELIERRLGNHGDADGDGNGNATTRGDG
jgi:putative Mg2+ transporter-C (MgtC) family protein